MREIVFDTETTGLDLAADRIVEIGCVELVNHIPSGRTFQAYINPERPVSTESERIHGLSDAFLADKPTFGAAIAGFFDFIGDAPLIAHNAEFDLAFMDVELRRVGRPGLDPARVTDSLVLARRRFPAGPNSLDALCSRFGIDLSRRTVHGALVDSILLADVYIELLGGRQTSLLLGEADGGAGAGLVARRAIPARPAPLAPRLGAAEIAAHQGFMATFAKGGLWAGYRREIAGAPGS